MLTSQKKLEDEPDIVVETVYTKGKKLVIEKL